MATAEGGQPAYSPELLRSIEAPQATIFECLALLIPTSSSVALRFRLCQRIQQFPTDQLTFWLPELVHVFVTFETESVALEDLLMSVSQVSTHCALSVFWFLQAALHDLKNDPHCHGFVAARRLSNKMQHMLFTAGEPPQETMMHENPQPAMMLAGMVCSAIAMPRLGRHMKPLLESQGKKQRSAYLIRRAVSKLASHRKPEQETQYSKSANPEPKRDPSKRTPSQKGVGVTQLGLIQMDSQPDLTFAHTSNSTDSLSLVSQNRSMPNLFANSGIPSESPASVLKTNYFRCETQFVYALNSISVRLLQVPKEARQSALQIELALLNEDLPYAEVDLPLLLPSRNGKQNRIVQICVAEATVLNSAEKAPFLLLIEFLRGDLTFDPQKVRNRDILRSNPKLRTHIFERPALPLSKNTSPQSVAGESSNEISPISSPRIGTSALNSPSSNSNEISSFTRKIPPLQLDDELEMDISEVSLLEREENGKGSSSVFNSRGPDLPIVETELNAATQVHEAQQFCEGSNAADLATQWRTASLILAQLDESTKLPKAEVQAIRQRIVASMQAMQTSPRKAAAQGEAGEWRLENDLKTSGLASEDSVSGTKGRHSDDDPSAVNLGEDWQSRKARIRRASKFGNHPHWDLVSVIVKTGDDLRQEALASQLIQRAAQIWKANGVGVWVRRMLILITSANSGLVETITNALSLHSIKKALTAAQVSEGGDPRAIAQLKQHFELKFGGERSGRYARAVQNFVQSLAAYSVLCYLLQIKDRHNGNILVDAEGHIIHIDFGFMLSNSPGHIGFESNTFKLTQEYVDLLGGIGSENWQAFTDLLVQAFLALRKHSEEFVSLMQIMGTNSTLPCFGGGVQSTAQLLRQRFMPDMSDKEAAQAFDKLIWKSYGSVYTRLYDQYQLVTQGIYN